MMPILLIFGLLFGGLFLLGLCGTLLEQNPDLFAWSIEPQPQPQQESSELRCKRAG